MENLARHQVRRLCNRSSIALTANTKPGKHLPYDHMAMARVRDGVAWMIETGAIAKDLVLNFDQVWCTTFRPRTRTLQERRHSQDSKSAKQVMETDFLRMINVSTGGDSDALSFTKTSRRQGGCSSSVAIDSWRVPHTLTTVSWNDGTLARGFVTCAEEYLSPMQRESLNKAGLS